jgi:hypothetical protein
VLIVALSSLTNAVNVCANDPSAYVNIWGVSVSCTDFTTGSR